MKNRYVSLPLIVLSLYTITVCEACKSQPQQKVVNSLTENDPLNRSPDDSIQSDSIQYSIQIKGRSNLVKVNGKVMKTTLDSTYTKNKISIRVSGEGNTVLINRTDKKSKVTVLQKGRNNQIKISQRDK
ncbi:hypothetical protein SAMN05444405_104205 [Bacteroides luti]|uniref:Uncharacterized protein n=1 Tax=Bacteroides luti TaxID=1297750 RepID=A0A1M4Y3F2_9BACE|nr:hypothetical protein [Bacteroides luti]SHF00344.1 hypothetical protein SAMN05444405_104205 [Bacteroides luti]